MLKKECIVLIPHFNNPIGLKKSIKSISKEADILVVDDGSNELFSEADLKNELSNTSRIIFLYLKTNLGIEKALNHGLLKIEEIGSYKYVARLDCGDVNVNYRIEKQIQFLDRNNEVYLVGSHVDFVDKRNKFLFRVRPPSNHRELKKKMYLNCMFIHPSVMFRVKAINRIGYYPINYKAAEDYAYFFKFILNFRTANIPEVLVLIESNMKGISSVNRNIQVINRIKILIKYFRFGFYPIYGLIRNILLLFFPLSLINRLKRNI